MTDPKVSTVVQFVVGKFIRTESYRDGLKTGTRASFHMEPDQLLPLLQFIISKEGCELDQAMRRFTACRDNSLQISAKAGKESGPWFGVFISALMAVLPAMLLFALGGKYLLLDVVLAALIPIVFFGMLYMLVWSPRSKVMESIWAGSGSQAEKLEALYRIQEISTKDLVMEHQRTQAIAFVAAAVLCIGGVIVFSGGNAMQKADFHKTFETVTVSAENQGTRYVVYDVDKGRYVDEYLSDAQQALTAEDVRGVLRITEGETKVGTYSGGGNAYKRNVTITLVDQRTGKTVGRKTISGGEPPQTIVSRNPFGKKNGYGSRPGDEEISRNCMDLIETFEEEQAQDAYHQEMSRLVVSADNAGTAYVVYDEDQALYLNKYLSDEHKAQSAADVRGVLNISSSEVEVGSYKGGGKAYQTIMFITLMDQRTGEDFSSEMLIGGEPPTSIYSFQSEGHGDPPKDEEIAAACKKLISEFEAQ